MAKALYRKYRPQTFAEVVGQNHIKTTLQSELESGKLAHAYLFSGPRGLGKTTTARLLAKAVNCLNRKDDQSEPCNSCEACLEITEGRSLDVIEVDAASHTGVDNVRENIIENSRFTPTSRKFKVFIIDEVHMLSTSAFNALLKTLEEPGSHVIFVLATTEIHKVPETIISRCQHFDFRKVNREEIIARLEKIVKEEKKKVDQAVLENVAYVSQGCLRDAESLLGQILSLGDKTITAEQAELVLPKSQFGQGIEFLQYLNKQDASAAIGLINHLVEQGVDLEKFTSDLIELTRKALLIKVSKNLDEFTAPLGKEFSAKLNDFVNSVSLELIAKMLSVLIIKKQDLKFADNIQMPLELAVIEIINPAKTDFNQSGGSFKIEQKVPIESTVKIKPILENPEPVIEVSKFEDKSKQNIVVKFHEIKSKWNKILEALKDKNYSLASSLKVSQISEFNESGALVIICPNKFLQQRLSEDKNKLLLEKTLEEIFSTKILYEVVVDESLAQTSNREVVSEQEPGVAKAHGLENLLDAFGGKVVE